MHLSYKALKRDKALRALPLSLALCPAVVDAHLCCGSAGTYSVLQPVLSRQLKADKLEKLQTQSPDVIATANVGCQLHLRTDARVPVLHWIELLDHEANK